MLALMVVASLAQVQVADTTFRLPRDARITVEGGFSTVRIEVGTGNTVMVRGGQAELDRSELSIVGAPRPRRGRGDDALHLTVPSWVPVSVSLYEGGLVVDGALETLEAELASGGVEVRGGTGTMSIEAMNGPVTVRNFTGRHLEIEALNDQVEIDGATGTINVELVNGGVALRNVRSAAVHVESVNGNLHWNGALERNGKYWFSTHNGNVVLNLPAATDARISAESVLGNITSNMVELDRNGRGRGVPREVSFVLGRSGAEVNIETFSGTIRVNQP